MSVPRRLRPRSGPGRLRWCCQQQRQGQTCELARAGLANGGGAGAGAPGGTGTFAGDGRPAGSTFGKPLGQTQPDPCSRRRCGTRRLAVELVIDGGTCTRGIESTIVALLPDAAATLLRPGAIPREQIEALIGPLAKPEQASITAPGQLQSHYAPRAHLRLNAEHAGPDEILLGFGPEAPVGAPNLSPGRRPDRGRGEPLPPAPRARRIRCPHDRGHAHTGRGTRRSDQRPTPAGRRTARNSPALRHSNES